MTDLNLTTKYISVIRIVFIQNLQILKQIVFSSQWFSYEPIFGSSYTGKADWLRRKNFDDIKKQLFFLRLNSTRS